MIDGEPNSDLIKVYGEKNLVLLESIVGGWISNNIDSRVRSQRLKSLADCANPTDILNFATTLGMGMVDFEVGFREKDEFSQRQRDEKKGD